MGVCQAADGNRLHKDTKTKNKVCHLVLVILLGYKDIEIFSQNRFKKIKRHRGKINGKNESWKKTPELQKHPSHSSQKVRGKLEEHHH